MLIDGAERIGLWKATKMLDWLVCLTPLKTTGRISEWAMKREGGAGGEGGGGGQKTLQELTKTSSQRPELVGRERAGDEKIEEQQTLTNHVSLFQR
jgi:hypothetical protein